MVSVKQVNMKGDDAGMIELSEAVFASPVSAASMHQAVVAHLAALRRGTHDTKDRGDVRGGGRKPWRQKHTGRARAGSSRSPVWIGGGVAHGPHPRDYTQKVNKKVRRLAIRSALTTKVNEGRMLVVTDLSISEPSTKKMCAFLSAVKAENPLILIHAKDEAIRRSASNIPGARVSHVDSVNTYDILAHKGLIATPEAARRLEEVFGR